MDIDADEPLRHADEGSAEQLLALAEQLGIDPVDLDEAVHDAASRYASDACNSSGAVDDDEATDALYDAAGHSAAAINNTGLSAQVPYLVKQYGAANTEGFIRDAAPAGARPR
ncbi:hypothetical protein ACFV3E_40830 [Streptomyces sp. NPDC059718]